MEEKLKKQYRYNMLFSAGKLANIKPILDRFEYGKDYVVELLPGATVVSEVKTDNIALATEIELLTLASG